MKKAKITITIILSIIGIFFLIGALLLCVLKYGLTTTDSKLKNYPKRAGYYKFFPELDSLPPYEDIHYKHIKKSHLLFTTKTLLLVVTYDKETYMVEKVKIESNINFLQEAVYSKDNATYYFIPEHEFSINSFDFRILEEAQSDYPKYFGMIAMSDEKNSIAYLNFSDVDLDYICTNKPEGEMKKFIEENFKYDW